MIVQDFERAVSYKFVEVMGAVELYFSCVKVVNERGELGRDDSAEGPG